MVIDDRRVLTLITHELLPRRNLQHRPQRPGHQRRLGLLIGTQRIRRIEILMLGPRPAATISRLRRLALSLISRRPLLSGINRTARRRIRTLHRRTTRTRLRPRHTPQQHHHHEARQPHPRRPPQPPQRSVTPSAQPRLPVAHGDSPPTCPEPKAGDNNEPTPQVKTMRHLTPRRDLSGTKSASESPAG